MVISGGRILMSIAGDWLTGSRSPLLASPPAATRLLPRDRRVRASHSYSRGFDVQIALRSSASGAASRMPLDPWLAQVAADTTRLAGYPPPTTSSDGPDREPVSMEGHW